MIHILPSISELESTIKSDIYGLLPSASRYPIRFIFLESQIDYSEVVKLICKNSSSLIPEEKKFIEQRNLYDRLTHRAGLYNLHGLRHAYAQKRYFELTEQLNNGHGWLSPLDGGVARNKLSAQERVIDKQAREIISRELGHSRIEIVKNYIG